MPDKSRVFYYEFRHLKTVYIQIEGSPFISKEGIGNNSPPKMEEKKGPFHLDLLNKLAGENLKMTSKQKKVINYYKFPLSSHKFPTRVPRKWLKQNWVPSLKTLEFCSEEIPKTEEEIQNLLFPEKKTLSPVIILFFDHPLPYNLIIDYFLKHSFLYILYNFPHIYDPPSPVYL